MEAADNKKEQRRKKVFELNQKGRFNNEIARILHINKRTVHDDLIILSKQGKPVKIHRISNQDAKEKWTKAINDIKQEAIPYFSNQGIKPSLRTVYYRLRARSLVQNTENDYKNLKTHTKEARLQERGKDGRLLYPALPIDCFADETRKLMENYSDYEPEEVPDADEYVDELIDKLIEGLGEYDGKGTPGGRWYNQPEYVEVWIEKFADAPTFEKWLEDKDVNIVVNKGYTSISFLWENIVRLKEKVKQFGAKHVHVDYYGDFDPSGEDMVKSLKKYFRRFGLSPSIIRKVALTQKQIDDYNIPLEPVKKSDNRYDSFEAKYGDRGAEIDAFIASDPEALKKILQDSVDEHFDQKKYDEMEKKYKTSTPVEELRLTHDGMIYRVQSKLSGSSWIKDVRHEWKYVYEDLEAEEDEEDNEDEEEQ